MENYTLHRTDTLAHYGVPGTHWGIRRYQNLDGSYKPGAEGRYAQKTTNKGTISGTKQNAKTGSGGSKFMSIGGSAASKSSKKDDTGAKSTGGGGGSSATEETGEKKKIDRKNIHLYDVSEKLPEKGTKKKGSGGGGGRGSSKKGAGEKSEGKGGGGSSEEKAAAKEKMLDKEKTAPCKPDAFYNRVKKLDFESLTDSDVSEIDNLIKQYQAYVSSNSYSEKKKKIIGEFIQKYASWKKNRKKNGSKQTERIMDDRKIFIKEIGHSEISDYELYHHGILGMKWGIRRYQNPDGSYTAEGKRRRGIGDDIKNLAKAKLGVYKDGDGNPYVSEKRRERRKAEEKPFKEAAEKVKAQEKPKKDGDYTLKNRVKSALGIYKDNDNNPYVSEKRRERRKAEEKPFKEASEKSSKLTADSGAVNAKAKLAALKNKVEIEKNTKKYERSIKKASKFVDAYLETGVLAKDAHGNVYAVDRKGRQHR